MRKMLLLFAVVASTSLVAQDNAKVIVEHFTNTFCGICTSRNPPILAVMDQYAGDLVHITYYPSVPYSQCPIYNYNQEENGAKESFYNIFGTPRFIINGQNASSSPAMFEQQLLTAMEETYAYNVQLDADGLITSDVNTVKVRIDKMGDVVPQDGRLFLAVVERSLNFAAANGEDHHDNVFRDMLTDKDGMPIDFSSAQSVEETFTFTVDRSLNIGQLYLVAYFQDMSDKTMLGATSSNFETVLTNTEQLDPSSVQIFPNPVANNLRIDLGDVVIKNAIIVDATGKEIWRAAQIEREIDTTEWPNGPYTLQIESPAGRLNKRFVVQH